MMIAQSQPYFERWTVVLTLISNLLLFGSVVFVGVQAYEQRRQLKMQKEAHDRETGFRRQELKVQANGNLHPFFLTLFENPHLADVWEQGRKDHLALDAVGQRQLKWACVYWFEHIAGIFTLAQNDLMEKLDLEGWERSLKDDFVDQASPGLVHWWCKLQEDYEEDFRNWVHGLVGHDLQCGCRECKVGSALL